MQLYLDSIHSSQFGVLSLYNPEQRLLDIIVQAPQNLAPVPGKIISKIQKQNPEIRVQAEVLSMEQTSEYLRQLFYQSGLVLYVWQNEQKDVYRLSMLPWLERFAGHVPSSLQMVNLASVLTVTWNLESYMAQSGFSIQLPLPQKEASLQEARKRILDWISFSAQSACYLAKYHQRKTIQETIAKKRVLSSKYPSLSIRDDSSIYMLAQKMLTDHPPKLDPERIEYLLPETALPLKKEQDQEGDHSDRKKNQESEHPDRMTDSFIFLGQKNKDQTIPNQKDSIQLLPDHKDSDHVLPDQKNKAHPITDQKDSPQLLPDDKNSTQLLQDHKDSAQLLPDQKNKDQIDLLELCAEILSSKTTNPDSMAYITFASWKKALHQISKNTGSGNEKGYGTILSKQMPILFEDGQGNLLGTYFKMSPNAMSVGLYNQDLYNQDLTKWKSTPGGFAAVCETLSRQKECMLEELKPEDLLHSEPVMLEDGKQVMPSAFVQVRSNGVKWKATPVPALFKHSGIYPYTLMKPYQITKSLPAMRISLTPILQEILIRLSVWEPGSFMDNFLKDSDQDPVFEKAREQILGHLLKGMSLEESEQPRPVLYQTIYLMQMLIVLFLGLKLADEGCSLLAVHNQELFMSGDPEKIQSILHSLSWLPGLDQIPQRAHLIIKNTYNMVELDENLKKIRQASTKNMNMGKTKNESRLPEIVQRTHAYLLVQAARQNKGFDMDLSVEQVKNAMQHILRFEPNANSRLALFAWNLHTNSDTYSFFHIDQTDRWMMLNPENRAFLVVEDADLPIKGKLKGIQIHSAKKSSKKARSLTQEETKAIQPILARQGIIPDPDKQEILKVTSINEFPAGSMAAIENRALNNEERSQKLLDALDLDAYAAYVIKDFAIWKTSKQSAS